MRFRCIFLSQINTKQEPKIQNESKLLQQWQKSLCQSRAVAGQRTPGKDSWSLPSAPVLLSSHPAPQLAAWIKPCRLAEDSRKTNPPSRRPRFIRGLSFREKTSGIQLRDPAPSRRHGPCLRRAASSREGHIHATALPPGTSSSAGLTNIWCSRKASACQQFSRRLRHDGICSRSKISLSINAQGMLQENSDLLGLGAGTDSLRVLSCQFLASSQLEMCCSVGILL